MTAKILDPVGLTVEDLLRTLQKLTDEGQGKAPVHALLGEHTGPVRGVDILPAWGFAGETVALVMADDDGDAAGVVLRTKGNSMTGDAP